MAESIWRDPPTTESKASTKARPSLKEKFGSDVRDPPSELRYTLGSDKRKNKTEGVPQGVPTWQAEHPRDPVDVPMVRQSSSFEQLAEAYTRLKNPQSVSYLEGHEGFQVKVRLLEEIGTHKTQLVHLLDDAEGCPVYNKLVDWIIDLMSSNDDFENILDCTKFTVTYEDADGDVIIIATTTEFLLAIEEFQEENVLKLKVVVAPRSTMHSLSSLQQVVMRAGCGASGGTRRAAGREMSPHIVSKDCSVSKEGRTGNRTIDNRNIAVHGGAEDEKKDDFPFDTSTPLSGRTPIRHDARMVVDEDTVALGIDQRSCLDAALEATLFPSYVSHKETVSTGQPLQDHVQDSNTVESASSPMTMFNKYNQIRNGTIVSLKGLVKNSTRNGEEGIVKNFQLSTGLYFVQMDFMDDDMAARVKVDNLFQHVKCRVHGIEKRPEINGTRGSLLDWDASKGRYTVNIEYMDEMVSLKPRSVILDHGTVVRITAGVESLPDELLPYNGHWGEIQGWDRESSLYKVQVSQNTTLEVDVGNVRVFGSQIGN